MSPLSNALYAITLFILLHALNLSQAMPPSNFISGLFGTKYRYCYAYIENNRPHPVVVMLYGSSFLENTAPVTSYVKGTDNSLFLIVPAGKTTIIRTKNYWDILVHYFILDQLVPFRHYNSHLIAHSICRNSVEEDSDDTRLLHCPYPCQLRFTVNVIPNDHLIYEAFYLH